MVKPSTVRFLTVAPSSVLAIRLKRLTEVPLTMKFPPSNVPAKVLKSVVAVAVPKSIFAVSFTVLLRKSSLSGSPAAASASHSATEPMVYSASTGVLPSPSSPSSPSSSSSSPSSSATGLLSASVSVVVSFLVSVSVCAVSLSLQATRTAIHIHNASISAKIFFIMSS